MSPISSSRRSCAAASSRIRRDRREFRAHFRDFLVQLFQHRRRPRPVEADLGRLVLQLHRALPFGQAARDPGERRPVLLATRGAFGALEVFPVLQLGVGIAAAGCVAGRSRRPASRGICTSICCKHMRMAADHLVADRRHHVAEVERVLLLRHARVEDHLQQQVAEFVASGRPCRRGRSHRRLRRLPRWCMARSLAKLCATSQGQPPTGSRSAAMIVEQAPDVAHAGTRHPRKGASVAERDEVAVEQRVALVVAQRAAARIQHRAARGLEDGLAGGGVPFAGRPEARIQVDPALGDPAELQRRTAAHHFAAGQRIEHAPGYARRDANGWRRSAAAPRPACACGSPRRRRAPRRGTRHAPRAPCQSAPVTGCWITPERRDAILDQRDVDGELAVALDELAGAVERIDQPQRGPFAARGDVDDPWIPRTAPGCAASARCRPATMQRCAARSAAVSGERSSLCSTATSRRRRTPPGSRRPPCAPAR